MKKIFITGIITSLLGLFISFLLFCFFSSVLDFFPWGDSRGYVLWGVFTVYIFVPIILLSGIVKVVLMNPKIQASCLICKLSPFLVSFLLLIPVFIEDSGPSPNFSERWNGVITSLFSALIFLAEFRFWFFKAKNL